MGVTASYHLSDAINDFYEKTYLESFYAACVLYDQCVKTDIPLGNGSVARWMRLTDIGKGSQITTAGTAPSATTMSVTYVTAKLVQYAKLLEFTDELQEDCIVGTIEEAMGQLGNSASQTIDDLIMKTAVMPLDAAIEELSAQATSAVLWNAASSVRTGIAISGTFTGYNYSVSGLPKYTVSTITCPPSATIDATEYPVTLTDIRFAANRLKKFNVPPMADGTYHFICDTTVSTNIQAQDGYATWNAYTREGQIKSEKGEVGMLAANVKLIESNNMFASTLGASSGSYLYRYSMLLGKNAIGVVQHGGTGKNKKGYEMAMVGKAPDKADPLGQYSTAGWKLRMSAKVLNASAGLILISRQ